ncbi:hypothetical protein [Haloarchaeobius amylolyticus]|uniref:hypothetical protein n=1 Tax=Haloarchaeobius amylolyticus TaxID=1198296 RepID=UPI0022717F3F|nr:hypothetical protein [Haloarchaeobius amylolyticus]
MGNISRRAYLQYTGAGLTLLTLGVGGLVALDGSGGPTTSEQDPTAGDGGAEPGDPPAFAREPPRRPTDLAGLRPGDALAFDRAENGDVDFRWAGVEFESEDGDRDVEFLVEDGEFSLDLEAAGDGSVLELTVLVGGVGLDLEVAGPDDVDVATIGPSRSFENDRGAIEYAGDLLRVEWDPRRVDLEIRGPAHLDWDGDEFEYRDRLVRIDWRRGTPDRPGTFEARYVG